MDPPPCVQNAMMTKDKKPFTYTPGGIDLSEVRSPRMARRIEQNANLGGAGDAPKPRSPQPQNFDSLPPSTLAAMRPQPQVQVFPSGPPPPAPSRGGVPPPPPPPSNAIPPPPPLPTKPLPTQKVQTGSNQFVERPDMTKIIPENPMVLLRKTGGPQPRNSLLDEMFSQSPQVEKPSVGSRSPPTPPQKSPQVEKQSNGYQSSFNGRGAPISPVLQQPQKRENYEPQPSQSNKLYQNQPPQHSSPEFRQEQPKYQPPVIERQQTKPHQSDDQPEIKTSTAHLGSLYIPPSNQQQQQRRIVSPPTPPERSPDSPNIQSPTLKEAPRPWQTKKIQQEELPPWAKKDSQEAKVASPPDSRQQQQWPQPEPSSQTRAHHQQQPIGVRIEIRTNPVPTNPENEQRKPNAVYVTQPLVFKHPGPQVQQQGGVEGQGAKVIPIRIEGANQGSRTPPTPSSDRSYSRQQSFGNNPTQSNSFKILQKFTNTDVDDDDDDTPITRHSPRFPQNFQQPVEQMGKIRVNDGDQNMTNTFKQVPRGSHQASNNGPKVRTIPIQIEGEQEYVHPSEQTVPEPKKYTGSSIPSRSFKILQAMTAPDSCANVNDQNEAFPYDEGSYYPQYPPHPYWPPYYPHLLFPAPHSEFSEDESVTTNSPVNSTSSNHKQAAMPQWGYVQPPSYPVYKKTEEGDTSFSSDPRTTPLPFWPHVYPPFEQSQDAGNHEDPRGVPQFPPYFDPYYYYYYYGYLPMYAPYPHYPMTRSDSEYTDDKSANETEVKASPGNTNTVVTEPVIKENVDTEMKQRVENKDSVSAEESYEDVDQNPHVSSLKSIRSVSDIKIYAVDQSESEDDDQDDVLSERSEDDTEEESSLSIVEDDTQPHQLSIILEESERTESRMRARSVMSDTTTVADNSEDECEADTQIRFPLRICVNIDEDNIESPVVVENDSSEINETEIYASFTLKSPSLTPRKRSPARDHSEEDYLNEKSNNNEESLEVLEEPSHEIVEEIEDDGKESDESEDWWGIIGKEDDIPKPRKIQSEQSEEAEESESDPSKTDDDCSKNNYAKVNYDCDNESSDNCDVLVMSNEESNKSFDSENNCDSFRTVEKDMLEEDKMPEVLGTEGSSIYDTLENIEVEGMGTLMEMDNFVAQLETIQKSSGLWKICINRRDNHSEIEKVTKKYLEPFERKPMDINKENDSLVNTASQNRVDNTEHHDKMEHELTKECSANYTEYNSSKSPRIDREESSIKTNGDTNQICHKETNSNLTNESDYDDSSDDSEYSSEDEQEDVFAQSDVNNNKEAEVKIPSIKERIQALRDNIKQKQETIQKNKTEIYVNEKPCRNDETVNNRTKSISTKSSMKSFEEFSEEEEEVDSGVTSDMSRHISDTEESSELKKLTRYQRAATHSRLFKLLQEGCDNEDMEENNGKPTTYSEQSQKSMANEPPRRDHLKLALSKNSEPEKYFGIDTISPVDERLVGELVQSFLKRKKAQVFRNMPQEKLFAAAAKILQEEFEAMETPTSCSSFLSPLRGSTGYSTAVHTPQEFLSNHEEYKQYYDSWKEAEMAYDENYDIIPSKAFKMVQEHSSHNKTGAILGLLAKCPRVLSSPNIHTKLMKLLENSESSTPVLDNPPLNSNEFSNAS